MRTAYKGGDPDLDRLLAQIEVESIMNPDKGEFLLFMLKRSVAIPGTHDPNPMYDPNATYEFKGGK